MEEKNKPRIPLLGIIIIAITFSPLAIGAYFLLKDLTGDGGWGTGILIGIVIAFLLIGSSRS